MIALLADVWEPKKLSQDNRLRNCLDQNIPQLRNIYAIGSTQDLCQVTY